MSKSLRPWILVTIGIIFNIGSAVITHYFIGINNQQLNQLQIKVAQYDTLIESQWRMKTETDRKQEFMLLLLSQSFQLDHSQSQPTQDYIAQQLKTSLQQQQLQDAITNDKIDASFNSINSISELIKQNIITLINDSYLEKVEVESQQTPLKDRNSLLYSIAIFLQVTGLILVLARDMR